MEQKHQFKSTFRFTTYRDGKVVRVQKYENQLMKDGIIKLMNMLGNIDVTPIGLGYIGFGLSDANPDSYDESDLITPEQGRFDMSTSAVNTIFPFDLTWSRSIVADNDFIPPIDLKEVALFFAPEIGGEIWNRVVLDPVLHLDIGDVIIVEYIIVLL